MVTKETSPTWKWLALAMLPVCGSLVMLLWNASTSAGAESATTLSHHGERIAATEAKIAGLEKSLDRIEVTLHRLEDKIDKLSVK